MAEQRRRRAAVSAALLFAAAAVVLLSAAAPARGDIPAHCLYEDVRGVWALTLGADTFDNTVDCSAKIAAQSVWTVELQFPDVVVLRAIDGAAVDADFPRGFWTLMYDQGFEIVVAGRKFFAFSAYVEHGGSVTSFCDRTSNGWFHDSNGRNWGCYAGQKQSSVALSTRALPTTHRKNEPEPIFANDLKFIRDINRAQGTWVARPYDQLDGQPLRAVQRRAGAPSRTDAGRPASAVSPLRSMAATTSSTKRAAARPAADVTALPSSFDWRNVDGVNYVSPVRNQGQCGSCYAFASAGMVEARLRVWSNNSVQTIISPQEVVSCSEYSQGCDGGFPYLVAGKYGEDFGLVSEDCFPYVASDAPCSNRCAKPARTYTTDYYYIGGYYGASTAELMQVELVQSGPIAVSFEVLPDFHNYHGGIYQHTNLTTFNPFVLTNHVVVVVGYGEEAGVPYWTVKNSWGEDWGENGFFRILRGADECGIESISVAVTPVL